MQGHRAATRRWCKPGRVQSARHAAATLGEDGLQGSFHEAEPVPIDADFVGGVYRCHRILAVLDGGDRGLDDYVTDAGGVCLTDRMIAIELNFDVQSVMFEYHGRRRSGIANITHQAVRILQGRGGTGNLDYQVSVLDSIGLRIRV